MCGCSKTCFPKNTYVVLVCFLSLCDRTWLLLICCSSRQCFVRCDMEKIMQQCVASVVPSHSFRAFHTHPYDHHAPLDSTRAWTELFQCTRRGMDLAIVRVSATCFSNIRWEEEILHGKYTNNIQK